jgi:hypothetical protein
MRRKPIILLGLALGGAHFLSSLLIVPLTLWIGELTITSPTKSVLMGVLHFLTRILYFPILGLALYPRHWFPGPWITIPIVVNSLLWGMLLAGVVIGLRRIR